MKPSNKLHDILNKRQKVVFLDKGINNYLRIYWEGGQYRVQKNISIHYKNNEIAFYEDIEELQNGITLQINDNDTVFIQLQNNNFSVMLNDQSIEKLNQQLIMQGTAIFAGLFSLVMGFVYVFLSIGQILNSWFTGTEIPPLTNQLIVSFGWFLLFAIFLIIQNYTKKNLKSGRVFIIITIFVAYAYFVGISTVKDVQNFLEHPFLYFLMILAILYISTQIFHRAKLRKLF